MGRYDVPWQSRIIVMLVEAGADIDARDEAGQTPLMLAAQSSGKYDGIRFLLTRGARFDLRDHTGADLESILAAGGRPDGRSFRTYGSQEADEGFQRELDLDFAKATTLVADVRRAGGTWALYLHEPRVRLDVLRELVARGRARPPSHMHVLARLFTELPTDLFRHVLGFWESDRDSPDQSDWD